MKQDRPLIIGIAGGSGSGKTYFANALKERLGASLCEILYQDNFYIDQSHRFDFDGGSVNFDHPDSIDFKLLAEKIKILKSGQSVQIPNYDFATHKRLNLGLIIEPKPIILVDGILILHSDEVRPLFDESYYVQTTEELRFQRRLERDVRERGRTPEGVHKQFYSQVKIMHDEFVEPSKYKAKAIIQDDACITKHLDLLEKLVKSRKF